MKQSIEKQIKQAFTNWDEQKADIGFDKDVLWQRMQPIPKKQPVWHNWSRIAAAALVILLTSGWAYSLYMNRQLQHENSGLTIKVRQQAEELKRSKKANIPINVSSPSKVVYQTEIKEVESPQMKADYEKLTLEYKNIENENRSLRQQLKQLSSYSNAMNDSIGSLLTQVQSLENEISLHEKNKALADKQSFTLKVNKEALKALSQKESLNLTKKQPSPKKLEIQLLSETQKPGPQAPALRGIGFKSFNNN